MTDQQLYIDGILMDLSEETAITLDIKSNLFRDITKMTANTTYTINLPKTAHNMAVLEFAGKPSTSSKYPYIFHTARYFRNGLEIIRNGRASVLSVKETIEISIYWGLFQALATLQSSDLKLNELNCTKYLRFNRNTKRRFPREFSMEATTLQRSRHQVRIGRAMTATLEGTATRHIHSLTAR